MIIDVLLVCLANNQCIMACEEMLNDANSIINFAKIFEVILHHQFVFVANYITALTYVLYLSY